MFTKCISLLGFLLVIGYNLICQITPASLTGTYAGEHWFKWEEDLQWTITTDTAYVYSIDTNGCWATTAWYGTGGTSFFETHYYFCYGNSENLFTRFHPTDSLTIVYDDISQPPPNYHVYSKRFYGIKISDSILVSMDDQIINEKLIKIFPNPFTNHLCILLPEYQELTVQIFNLNGKIQFQSIAKNTKQLRINTAAFISGVYILQLVSEEKIRSFRILKL